jgi:hypothetical protein
VGTKTRLWCSFSAVSSKGLDRKGASLLLPCP